MVLIGMFMIANTRSFLFNLDSSTINNELANFTMAGETSNNEVLLQFNQVKHHRLTSQLDAWWLNTKKPKLYFSMKLLFECLSSSPFHTINLILFLFLSFSQYVHCIDFSLFPLTDVPTEEGVCFLDLKIWRAQKNGTSMFQLSCVRHWFSFRPARTTTWIEIL